jgi:tetratricopeptide (TPR) repeat protein
MAQRLSQEFQQTVQTARSGEDLRQVQQQMGEANWLLSNIPPWSSRHGEAQGLLQSFQPQMAILEQVMAAESRAATALQRSKTLPQPIAEWQGIQSLWREAIAQLEAIPPASPLHQFAQRRITDYRQSQASLNQNISAEQQAKQTLESAKNIAQAAEARQGIAQTLENWQLARSTWQVALNTLKQVPATTTSYGETLQLIADYTTKLTAARDRVTQEQLASKAFLQATRLEEQAKSFQAQNQWNKAVATWREAISVAKQVPNGTFYHTQTQPKLVDYNTKLKDAELQLQDAIALQKVRADLDRACSGSPKICTYTLNNRLIRVQFTVAYQRALKTAVIIGQSGDAKTLGGTINHYDSLGAAFETIANNAGIELMVYNVDGEQIGYFKPSR